MSEEYSFTVDISAINSEDTAASTAGTTAQVGLTTSFVVASGSNFIVGSSMESMWSLINTCQMIFYLGLASVYYPQNIIQFFKYLGMANVDNVFLAALTEISLIRDKKDNREAINYRYSQMGYETISFIENISDLVALAILILFFTL